jgi:hypothetical protein
MKKVLFTLILLFATTAQADRWRHGGGHYYWHPGYGWVAPVVVGGAIVYAATRPPVVIQQPMYIQQTYPPAQPTYPPPAGYHWEAILDANCNCYKTVLVPN